MPSVDAPPVDVVAMVGSAGGIRATESVLEQLPVGLEAAVVILLHLMAQHRSHLVEILGRRTPMAVKEAEDGEKLVTGTVFVAPPDTHLRVEGGRFILEDSALVHFVRPSADVLLFSLAGGHAGRRLVVVLSGSGVDGAAGAAAVRRAGGSVLAQDEATSEHFGMPGAAILAGGVDQVLALNRIGAAVVDFVHGSAA